MKKRSNISKHIIGEYEEAHEQKHDEKNKFTSSD